MSVFVHTCAFTMMKSDPTHTPSVSGKNSEWEREGVGWGVGGGGGGVGGGQNPPGIYTTIKYVISSP